MSQSNVVVGSNSVTIRICADIAGSGRFIFTPGKAQYEHKFGDRPANLTIDGKPWTNLDVTPASWREISSELDLTKASVIERQAKDTIALERTAHGFDVHVGNSLGGVDRCQIAIAIPRRT